MLKLAFARLRRTRWEKFGPRLQAAACACWSSVSAGHCRADPHVLCMYGYIYLSIYPSFYLSLSLYIYIYIYI